MMEKLEADSFVRLYLQAEDETLVLTLISALLGLHQIRTEIDRRIGSKKIGAKYLLFLQRQEPGTLQALIDAVKPVLSYYSLKDDTPKDREQEVCLAIEKFIERLSRSVRTNLEDWSHIPASTVEGSKSLKAPTWEKVAPFFLQASIKQGIQKYHPILSGKVENAPLQVRTHFRDRYAGQAQKIAFPTTGEEVEPKEVPLEGEVKDELDPEALLADKQARERQGRMIQLCLKEDSALYWALVKHDGNKIKAAKELRISRPTLYERLDRIGKHIKNQIK